ncbi:MAG: hypothetical protein WCP70_09520 [Methanothrix sp.]
MKLTVSPEILPSLGQRDLDRVHVCKSHPCASSQSAPLHISAVVV